MRTGINAFFARADRIIAVSEVVAQALQVQTRIPNEKIITIPNGVDANRFQFHGSPHALRQQLSLPIDRVIVLAIGRLTHQKGYPYLLEALALIPQEDRPLLLIVGEGPDRSELELKARVLKLVDDVRFLGHRQDIPSLLAAADLFVLASLWEGLPLVLLEAMAATLPAVVTAVGGNTTVIEDGKSGLLVPPADEKALATALRRLIHDPLTRDQMRQAARERFENRFSLQTFVEAHESLYEELYVGRLK
jgi:glycosyltransferase involved in cell wall biosynthesis